MGRYPFYIEREERPTLSQQLRDAADALKIFEELRKPPEKKEEKKDDKKGDMRKTYILLGLATPFLLAGLFWFEVSLMVDLIIKLQNIKVK